MIQLLYTVIFVEMGLILAFVFRTPFRVLVIKGIDQVKRGRGPVIVKTVAGTVAVVLLSSLYGMVTIQKRWIEESNGISNPTDQVLFAAHMLESTLMGAMLFLALMIDRLHHYMKDLRLRRKTMECSKKQNRNVEVDDVKRLEEEMMTVREKLKHVECQLEKRGKDLASAEANAVALRKQSEGFLLEYDRLLEENQNLRNQLQTLDRKLSWSGSKKNP